MTRLSPEEMESALSSFTTCFEYLLKKRTETDKQVIEEFLTTITLIVPAYSLRPDQIERVNNLIFTDTSISSFMFELSFRFFTLTGNTDDFVNRLAFNLKEGLIIDGPNKDKNIIPLSIASSCPINVFSLEAFKLFTIKSKSILIPDVIVDFLVNNKHLILVYLMYLTAE